MRKTLYILAIPLMMVSCQSHDEKPESSAYVPVAQQHQQQPSHPGTVTITEVPRVAGQEQTQSSDAKRMPNAIVFDGKQHIITMAGHRRPKNPSKPGYILNFSGQGLTASSERVTIMMQVPAQLTPGTYKVAYDPEHGAKLGNRPASERTVIGEVVRQNPQGQIVPSSTPNGNILKEGAILVEKMEGQRFKLHGEMTTSDGAQYEFYYDGPQNIEY